LGKNRGTERKPIKKEELKRRDPTRCSRNDTEKE